MKLTEKPWGHEILIAQAEGYVMKELFMLKGNRCSLQYHEKKHESFYVVAGKMKLTVGDSVDKLEELIMFPGDSYVLPQGKIHRVEAMEDSVYIEASTDHLQDVVRLADDFKRA